MTSGGSESLLLAVKAYRDYARNVKGIRNPEILMPASGHAAFDKASQLYRFFRLLSTLNSKNIQFGHFFRMRLVRIPVDPKTHKADVKAMEKAINKNTCMVFWKLKITLQFLSFDDVLIPALGIGSWFSSWRD